MKTIIGNFRRVIRYVVAVSLAALSFFSVFADCTAIWSESEGGWWVDCHVGGSASIFISAGGGGGGGSGGSCTNCTAMTPEECDEIKSSLLLHTSDISSGVTEINAILSSSFGYASEIEQNLNQLFEENSYPPTEEIYDYLNSSVFPLAYNALTTSQALQYELLQIQGDVQFISGEVNTLQGVSDEMNCSACQSAGGGGGTSGGGGGDSGGGGTTPSGCPCFEFIQAVKVAVDNCKIKLDDIDDKLDAIKSRLESWDEIIKQIKNDVYAIRQTTDRMDDFFKDDTEINFKKLIEHTLTLSNAVFSVTLKLPPNLYWTEYTNATQFTDDSGSSINWLEKGRTIETPSGDATIDFGEYNSLNWFQRMEFLLGHIAGIFSTTNSTNADFSDGQKESLQTAENDLDNSLGGKNGSIGELDSTKSILEQMVNYVEQAESSLNPFHGLFDHSSGSVRSITFLPDVSVENSLVGNTMPTISMDLTDSGDGSFSIIDLVDLSHNLTTFLWLVSFFVIDLLAIIKFVQCLIALNRWYWKIYNSWVSTMFNGSGR